MFWLVFIFALIAYGICHFANVYRIKALESGEANIGLFKSSICPMCRKCKIFILTSFIITVVTAFIISHPEGNLADWSFLSLRHNSWELVHIIIAVLFVGNVFLYFYIHQEVLASGFKKLLHIKVL